MKFQLFESIKIKLTSIMISSLYNDKNKFFFELMRARSRL